MVQRGEEHDCGQLYTFISPQLTNVGILLCTRTSKAEVRDNWRVWGGGDGGWEVGGEINRKQEA